MFKIVQNSTKIYKGNSSEIDSYSVFWDNMKLVQTSFCSQLQEKNITDLYVCGIAYDVCVGTCFIKSNQNIINDILSFFLNNMKKILPMI